MDTFITPCILPDTDSVQQVAPATHWLSLPERQGGCPTNALGCFLEKINLFQIQENDDSNIEDMSDLDSDSCAVLFAMAVEPAFPPNLELKRFKPLLTNSQPRSHNEKVENTPSSSHSAETVRIHNGSPTAKTMRSLPKSNEGKVVVPPGRNRPTQTMGTREKNVKRAQSAASTSQSEAIVHLRLTKDTMTKALETPPGKSAAKTLVLDTPPSQSATKTSVLSPRSGQKKIPPGTLLRSRSLKTMSAHPGLSQSRGQKKIPLGAHFSRCSSARTIGTRPGSRDAKSASTEDSSRKKRSLFCQRTADDPQEGTRVFMANGRQLLEI